MASLPVDRTPASSPFTAHSHRSSGLPQHQMFDYGSMSLSDKTAGSLQQIKFFDNCIKRIGTLFHGNSVLSDICYRKQP